MAFPRDITPRSPLLLIGAGHMGGALLKGWLKAGLSRRAAVIVDHKGRKRLEATVGVRGLSVYRELAELSRIPPPRVAVFAVKPQAMAGALRDAKHLPLNKTLLVSVAAGIPMRAFEQAFGPRAIVIRALPNMPAALGKGVSVIVGNSNARGKDFGLAEGLMKAVGKTFRVRDEALIDAVTVVSGSGPAYFYALVEALEKAAVAAGLPKKLAGALAAETFFGAAALMEASGESAEALRKKVASPKGTTEAALKVLMKKEGLDALLEKAVLKARARARELSK